MPLSNQFGRFLERYAVEICAGLFAASFAFYAKEVLLKWYWPE